MFFRLNYHKLFSTLMEPKKNTTRRDKLISLEQRARDIWTRFQYFAVEPNEKPKFFQTFPYPYMNGTLHLGHAFSMTKCDFNAWYKRLCGFNVLFPFGFHCTGMPIASAAKKLQFELETYGNPPKLPVLPKNSEHKYQYDIMTQMDIPVQKIPQFVDATFWTQYFPPRGHEHIKKFGTHVDMARSFITTEINPYYDSFIRWQFTLLKQKGCIKFGKRPSIYSPKDKQMCADHDRSEGEGVGLDEYTLIKIEVIEQNEIMKKYLEGRKVFLVAATLRPQTMYGQTSCFLLPSGDYCAVEMKNDEVFICSEKSAANMSYQFMTKEDEKVEIIHVFKGDQLMGLPLKAPLAVHEKVYTLPMMTISMKKGTGVVTCVPSDSPDDWMATCDLKSKKALRQKYGVTEQMVSLKPIQIIHIPTYGNLTAVALCEQKKIKSQNDTVLLAQAKDEAYKKGFHEGKMLIGSCKDMRVNDAKNMVKNQLIQKKQALSYYEPSGHVVSRSGDVCVVAYCDQWYLNYAQEDWKKKVMDHINTNFTCNSEALHNELAITIDWLKEWGCSRSFGLGTKLPFDQQYLIESLSDSTIYFAYYTVAHMLQGDINGSIPGQLGIKPEEISGEFWSHIFLGKDYKEGKIPQYKMDKLRQSFEYWYPLDLRCSAKDLIKNHLTMALFNHAAIWNDPKYWPKSYYCNGYILVEGKKMSKSQGNFITLTQAMEDYGSDAVRLACAQAGDSINDANFTKQNANAAIMQLSTLEMFFNKSLQHRHMYRSKEDHPDYQTFDQIFEAELQEHIISVKEAYEKMTYRDVVKYGLHDFVSCKDSYLLNCDQKPRYDLIEKYIYFQLIFLYPLCPHFCEVSYIDHFLTFAKNYKNYPKLMGDCRFPQISGEINYAAIKSHQYFLKFMVNSRETFTKVSKPKKNQEPPKFQKAVIIFREKFQDYQLEMLKMLRKNVEDGQIKTDWRKEVNIENKEEKTKCLKFAGFIEKEFKTLGLEVLEESLPFNEIKVLNSFVSCIKREFPFQIQFVEVHNAPEKPAKGWKETLAGITPGNPLITFE